MISRHLESVYDWSCFPEWAADPPKGPHPPYTIHKIGGKFFVKNALGMKKNKEGYSNRADALALQRALYSALPKGYKP